MEQCFILCITIFTVLEFICQENNDPKVPDKLPSGWKTLSSLHKDRRAFDKSIEAGTNTGTIAIFSYKKGR
jgi:hypothetical protein